MKEGKWIKFVNQGKVQGRKMDIYFVLNKDVGNVIGEVKWYGPWRQYSFFPRKETVYERQCLMDITKFIHHLMQEYKQKRAMLRDEKKNEKKKKNAISSAIKL